MGFFDYFRRKPTKDLFGVDHSDSPFEQQKIRTVLGQEKYTVAGLELPENHMFLREKGLRITFFSDLADHLENDGVKIVPIDSAFFRSELDAAEFLAHAFIETRETGNPGRYLDAKIAKYARFRNSRDQGYHVPPEAQTTFRAKKRGDLYRRARLLLDEVKTPEGIVAFSERINAEREKVMLERIAAETPDVVVVGSAHAQAIRNQLSDYKFTNFVLSGSSGKEYADGRFL